MFVVTDSECTGYGKPGHPENPERISRTIRHLQKQIEIDVFWEHPLGVADPILELAHTREHLRELDRGDRDFDGDTPFYPGIGDYARRSVGAAMKALELAGQGNNSFSLMRPPGHHATASQAMGFCYLNQAAICTLHARACGVPRVAVFDFDVHHGNGTEAILKNKEGAAFFSIHQHPCYPGTGAKSQGNCRNYPVAPGTSAKQYREIAVEALEDLTKFEPELLIVSAGFDAYAKDPLAQLQLTETDFHWIGLQLRQFGIPVVSILEGGYSPDLPELILSYLRGIDGL
ncbi:MAG: hypothetical protein PHD76_05145 [Methylacidiphilales bacterium]|nr:hypothetical protein [Candidatus Methylacidiphilales bacterium]